MRVGGWFFCSMVKVGASISANQIRESSGGRSPWLVGCGLSEGGEAVNSNFSPARFSCRLGTFG